MPSTTLNTYQKLHKQFSVTSSLISPYCTYIVEASLILRTKNSFSCFEFIIRLLKSVNVSFLILEFPYYFFQYFLPRSLRVSFLFFLQNVPVLFFSVFPSSFLESFIPIFFFTKSFLLIFLLQKVSFLFFFTKSFLPIFLNKKFPSYFSFTKIFLPIFFIICFLPIFFSRRFPSYFFLQKVAVLFLLQKVFLPHFFSVSFLFFRVFFFNIDVSFQILIRGKQYLKTFVALKYLAL